jgi:hypothetical protein
MKWGSVTQKDAHLNLALIVAAETGAVVKLKAKTSKAM